MRVAIGTAPSGYTYSQGTSFSTPLTAAAAALILSAHPEATPMQVRGALMSTAQRKDDGTARTISYPNNFYGWGLVDAYAAALSLGPVVSNIPLVHVTTHQGQLSLAVQVRTASTQIIDLTRFRLFARRTGEVTMQSFAFTPGSENGLYVAYIPVSHAADTLFVGYLTIATDGGPERRRPAGSALFDLHPTPDSITQLFPPVESDIPSSFILEPNYPNPFNAGTVIVFRLPSAAHIDIEVYSVLGQKVRTLYSGMAEAGTNSIHWSPARDENGDELPSGLYLIRMSSPAGALTHKALLVK
jgi:hypothetical protein